MFQDVVTLLENKLLSKKLRKRDRFKKAIKSRGKKIGNFAKSRIVTKFLPLFGLIAIFTPDKAHAFTLGGYLDQLR